MKKTADPLAELGARLAKAASLIDAGRLEEAGRIYTGLIRRFPGDPRLRHLSGLTLYERNRLPEALAELEKAVELSPAEAVFRRSLGDCLAAMGQSEKAVAQYRAAASLGLEDDPGLLLGLGNALAGCGDIIEAQACYRKAITLDGTDKQALNNLGKLLHGCGQTDTAISFYRRALDIDPDYAPARFNLSSALLMSGNYRQGWQEYEWRFACHGSSIYPHRLEAPRWHGEPFAGTLLVHAEQGYGDMIFFARYLPLAKKMTGTLVLEAHKPLVSLLSRMEAVDRVVEFDPDQKPAAGHQLQVPVGSLPLVLGAYNPLAVDNRPYLQADERRRALWAARLGDSGKFRVGLVWSGSGLDPRRDISPQLLEPLARMENVEFFSLQKGPAAALPENSPLRSRVRSLGAMIKDFDDTAAICAGLDLLISVDTAAAHLAGAMGLPVWVLLPRVPDWRWQPEGETCSWYPSATCLRQQEEGDWRPVIAKMVRRLARLALNSQRKTAGSQPDCHDRAEKLFEQASRMMDRGNYLPAIEHLEKSLALKPDFPEAWYNLGYIFHAIGRLDQAQLAYANACRHRPGFTEALVNRAVVLMELGDHAAAQQCFGRALAIDPFRADAHYNLGNLCLAKGRHREAAQHFMRAATIDPLHFRAWGNLGWTFYETGQYQEAEKYYAMALTINPEYAEAHLNLAVLCLLQGRFSRGWKHYSWRFRVADWKRIYPHRLKTPCWDGSDLNGRTILVHTEQGIGDCLQFVRYLPLVKAKGGRIVFESRKSLASLLESLPSIDRLCILDPDKPNETGVDCHIGLASLPAVFGTTAETIPAEVPYLWAQAEKVGTWQKKLPEGRLRVGLVWGGNATYRQRSLDLAELTPLLEAFPEIAFIGLQKGPAAGQAAGNRLLAANLGPELKDFADTAAVVHCLDLIISIDTAAAHLAGAMARPVWTLLPRFSDWRWGTDGGQSPWYPTMRLFRQPVPGDWAAVVAMLKEALAKFKP